MLALCCAHPRHFEPTAKYSISGYPCPPKGKSITVGFQPGFPVALRPSALDGFLYWNSILGRKLFQETSRTPDVVVKLNPVHSILDDGRYTIIGDADNTFVEFFPLWTTSSEVARESFSRHEVGHVLGLEHTPEGAGCIMDSVIYTGEATPRLACPGEILKVRTTYGQP